MCCVYIIGERPSTVWLNYTNDSLSAYSDSDDVYESKQMCSTPSTGKLSIIIINPVTINVFNSSLRLVISVLCAFKISTCCCCFLHTAVPIPEPQTLTPRINYSWNCIPTRGTGIIIIMCKCPLWQA